MRITARYSTVCPACDDFIAKGSVVEWRKHRDARHLVCPKYAPQVQAQPSEPKPTPIKPHLILSVA